MNSVAYTLEVFLKPYPAEVECITLYACTNRMAVLQVYGYHVCREVKRRWLNIWYSRGVGKTF